MKKKPEPYSKEWRRKLYEVLIEDHGDEYKSCSGCGWPTNKRYVCSHCGSYDP